MMRLLGYVSAVGSGCLLAVVLPACDRHEDYCPPNSESRLTGITVEFSTDIALPYHATIQADGGELWEFDSSLGGGIDAVPGADDYAVDGDLWGNGISLHTTTIVPRTLYVLITRPVGGYLTGTEADPNFRAEGCFDLEDQSYDRDWISSCVLLEDISENQLDVAAPVPPTCTF
jgi:hypothetical protein